VYFEKLTSRQLPLKIWTHYFRQITLLAALSAGTQTKDLANSFNLCLILDTQISVNE
jgi:hypothetical protein